MKQNGILLEETDRMKRLMSIKNDKVILKDALQVPRLSNETKHDR